MSSDPRLKEAQDCIAKAEKYLKTSIWQLKMKPEYELAAYEYDRAAVCFKNAGQLDKSIELYLKTADCHKNSNSTFHEAKSKEQAAMVSKDAGDLDRAISLFEESAQLYLDCNNWDTSAQTIDKAGKIFEQIDIDRAIILYKKGLKIVREANRTKTVISLSHRLLGLHLRKKQYKEAIQVSEELIETYKEIDEYGKIGQLGLGLVIIGLLKGDSVDSRKFLSYLSDIGMTSFPNEMQIAKALIVRYENGDNDGLQEALKNGTVRAMDNAYLRIIKDLRVESVDGAGGHEEEEDDLR